MSDRRSAADLGVHAETALAAFPFPERDWEKDARAIEARLQKHAPGANAEALLASPLPNEPGEPSAFSATTTPLTSSGVRTQSLAEIARRSVEQKQAAARELARASLALAASNRTEAETAAAVREAVSSVRAVKAPPAPPPNAKVEDRAVSAVVAPPRRIVEPPIAPALKTSRELPWSKLSVGVGVLALAASAMLWLRKPASEPAPQVTATVAPITTNTPRSATTAALTAEPGNTVALAAPTAIDPSSLSQEASAKPSTENAHAKSASTAATAPTTSTAIASGSHPENVVLEDEKPSAPIAAEKPADKALPPDPALRPAENTGGATPMKPSTGAVQAALGAVMSGARHCVAGDDAPSSAVVVFASDGHVQSVNVSGPAAGKPAAACIEGQLSRARVQPFASTTFSISATVRPD